MQDFISIREASLRWGVTERRVQELCKSGTVVGATRLGRVWMIPSAADRPPDRRTRNAKTEPPRTFLRRTPLLIHTNLYDTPGSMEYTLATLSAHPEEARLLRLQFAYLRGEIDTVIADLPRLTAQKSDYYTTLCQEILLSLAAVWQGDVYLWQRAHETVSAIPCSTAAEKNLLSFWLAVMDSTLYDTKNFPEWFCTGMLDAIPSDSLPTAKVVYCKYLFICAFDLARGRRQLPDVSGMGLMRTLPFIFEPMISSAKSEKTLIAEIYLHLLAASAYHNLGDNDRAIPHVDEAIALALPDRLYECLVEYRTSLDTLLDDRLAIVDMEALREIRELHRRMMIGWRHLHNQLLGNTVSGAMTVREREVAKLAAFGLSNAEIARRLHIELSSVKRYIFSAMNKVGAEKRGELGKFL